MLRLSLITITKAASAAMKFLKKHFSIDGITQDKRTNIFIIAKQNADDRMQAIPFALLSMKDILTNSGKRGKCFIV